MLTDQQIDEFLEMLAKSPTSARDMVRGLFAAHEAKAAPAVPQGEPFGYFRAESFGWTDCAETEEGAIALYEAPPDVETLRKELAGANDFIKSLADVCQKYEELLGYRKTNAPEGASELAEAKGESSVNTELGLASDKSTCQHDFALDPKSSIRICLKCGTPERRAIKPTPAAPSQPVNRPQNCGTSFCSCIECVCEPEPVTLTDDVPDPTLSARMGMPVSRKVWGEFKAWQSNKEAALREKEGK